jgi:beta-glucanase (GH16 family)
MANLGFALRTTLGLIPKTEKIESQHQNLLEEYNKLNEYSQSDELKEYLELQQYIGSDDFKNTKKQIAGLNFKSTDEYQKELRYNKLKKDKRIINYFKVLNSSEYKRFIETDSSDKLKKHLELNEYLNSNEHKQIVDDFNIKLKTEKDKQKELKNLAKSKNIKLFYKISNSTLLQNFNSLHDSAELQEYIELQEFISSKQTDKSSDEYKQNVSRFKTLKKLKKFKDYFKFLKSSNYKHYNNFKDSDDLKYYEELKVYIASDDYQMAITQFTYVNTNEYKKEEEYNNLKKDTDIVHWEKFKKLKQYKLFKDTENSELLAKYEELDEFINSDKFKEFKEYMLDKNKWQKTDDYQKEVRYAELQKSENIKWYFAIKNSNKFDELKQWKLIFEDDFDTGKIDENKWMNSFFWGKMLLNDRYVIAGEKQYFTDNNNFELNGSTLKIITKKEQAEGKVWHPVHGFYTQKFEYTSGMLSTAHSYRHQYGKIEAKIKLSDNYPVYQALWLKGEKIIPEIDILKFNMDKKNRLQMSTIWGDTSDIKSAKKRTDKINGGMFTKNYFIYTLEWSKNKLTWKINGIEAYSTSEGIPDEPLYLMLSAGIVKEPEQNFNSSALEIDWIRCYEPAENQK